MNKVLVIAYYWPPAGGPGVQRWLKFVKYLPEFGIEPIVYVPEDANYPLVDTSLLEEVPNGVQVIKHPIREPYRLAALVSPKKSKRISSGIITENKKQGTLEKLLLYVRGNFFIPDARKYWVKPSVRFLKEFIQENNIITIITTGPPHSVHLIGLDLKKQLDIKWIADFRDPWTTIGYHKKLKLNAASQKKHQQLEHQVLNTADKLVVTSNTTSEEFKEKTNAPIKTITNGYDGGLPEVKHDLNFTISHIGSLLTDRNPKALWQALSELIKENKALSATLQIQLIGVVGDGVLDAIKAYGLSDYVKTLGYLSHEAVLGYQSKSQILLLTEIDSEETRGIIPGKLFEYMKAKRPILALGPTQWEAGKIVEETQSGRYLNAKDANGTKAVVLNWFEKYQTGKLTIASKGIEKYHRRELTQSLVDFIEPI